MKYTITYKMKKYLTWALRLIGAVVLVWLIVQALSVIVNTMEPRMINALEMEGYSNIQLGGMALFACSDSDFPGRTFQAEKDGKIVSGYVCCGLLKACTVRW